MTLALITTLWWPDLADMVLQKLSAKVTSILIVNTKNVFTIKIFLASLNRLLLTEYV